MLGFRNDFCFADIPGKNQKSADLMRIHKLWQFCGYKSYITGAFILWINISNIKNFDMSKILDFVPESPIPIFYGFVTHICKNLWANKLRFHNHMNSTVKPNI